MFVTNVPRNASAEVLRQGAYWWAVVANSSCSINIWKNIIEPKIGVHAKRLELAKSEAYAEVLEREICWLRRLLENLRYRDARPLIHELLLELMLRVAALAGREVRYEHGAVDGVHYIVVYVGDPQPDFVKRLAARYLDGLKLLKDGELGEATFL